MSMLSKFNKFNKFNKIYNTIMEEISSKPYDFSVFYAKHENKDNGRSLRYRLPIDDKTGKCFQSDIEKIESFAKEAIEIRRKFFEDHLKSGEPIRKLTRYYLGEGYGSWGLQNIDRHKVKITGIDGDKVSYEFKGFMDRIETGEFDLTDGENLYTTTEIENGIEDEINEFLRERYAEVETERQAKAEKAAELKKLGETVMQSPEYKAFDKELREKFKKEYADWIFSGEKSEEMLEFIKSQPNDIRAAFVVATKRAASYKNYDEHLEGKAYYDDCREKDKYSSNLYSLASEIEKTL